MIFIDSTHQRFYEDCLLHANCTQWDVERHALFYTLGIMETTRYHIHSIYDFETNSIMLSALNEPFQTSGSLALTQLGFVLYNNFRQQHPEHDDIYLSPSLLDIVCALDQEFLPYLFQAIALRQQATTIRILP